MSETTDLADGVTTRDRLQMGVALIERVAEDVVILGLECREGGVLPTWQPGAHLEIELPSGRVRHYSLCGDPVDDRVYTVAVLRARNGTGGSDEIHDELAVGDTVFVRGPRNHFPLEAAEEYLFLAGGIGITPIRTMVREAARQGIPWTLLYGGRSRATMPFLEELGREPGGRLLIHPQDDLGLPDLAGLLGEATKAEVYCCGPSAMIEAAAEVMDRLGRSDSLHYERFGPASTALVNDGQDTSFEVELRQSGVTATVPADRSILDVVSELVPNTLSSCGEGYCGTCETRVIEGVPDHRDTLLSDEDKASNETILICVSRSRTPRLVLDV